MIPCDSMLMPGIYIHICSCMCEENQVDASKYSTHLPHSESTNHLLWTKSSSSLASFPIIKRYQKHSLIPQVKATVFCHGFSGTSPCKPDSLVDSTNAMRAMGDPTPTSRLDIAGHMACAPPRAGVPVVVLLKNTYYYWEISWNHMWLGHIFIFSVCKHW